MNITCSAGKGEMTKEECLACALRGENTCGYSYPLLKAMYYTMGQREGIHVTDLTTCMRKAYYQKTVPPAEYVHNLLNMWLGTSVHRAIEEQKYTDDKIEAEIPVKWRYGNLDLLGTADLILDGTTLIEIKTTRWIYPDRLPYGSHETQLNMYALMLAEQGVSVNKLQIQYIDMTGPNRCKQGPSYDKCSGTYIMRGGAVVCERCGHTKIGHVGAILYDVEMWHSSDVAYTMGTRMQALAESLERHEVPDGEPGWICNYCPFSQCENHPDYEETT